jgi:protein-tyrosine kinase
MKESHRGELNMSRNYELLLQAKTDQGLLQVSSQPVAAVHKRRSKPDLAVVTREEEMKLVQSVFLSPGPDAPKVVVFSGFGHGCGCSRICARVSEILAVHVAGSVCVVDANLRTPGLHQYFGVDNKKGLVESISTPGPIRDFAHRLPGGDLWVLTRGFHSLDSHSLLTSEGLRSRIKELRAEFNHVLIDAPPVSLYADASLLGQLADGVILVMEADSTRRETARLSKENLDAAHVRLLGAVWNKRTFPIPEALYHRI